jgi:hypothetical protein
MVADCATNLDVILKQNQCNRSVGKCRGTVTQKIVETVKMHDALMILWFDVNCLNAASIASAAHAG